MCKSPSAPYSSSVLNATNCLPELASHSLKLRKLPGLCASWLLWANGALSGEKSWPAVRGSSLGSEWEQVFTDWHLDLSSLVLKINTDFPACLAKQGIVFPGVFCAWHLPPPDPGLCLPWNEGRGWSWVLHPPLLRKVLLLSGVWAVSVSWSESCWVSNFFLYALIYC